MTNLISRTALLDHFRKQRDDFVERFASKDGQSPRRFTIDFDEELDELDQRIALVENFPAVKPIAKLVNNNQVGHINLIEIAPGVTINIGTDLYVADRP